MSPVVPQVWLNPASGVREAADASELLFRPTDMVRSAPSGLAYADGYASRKSTPSFVRSSGHDQCRPCAEPAHHRCGA